MSTKNLGGADMPAFGMSAVSRVADHRQVRDVCATPIDVSLFQARETFSYFRELGLI
ncbi:MAG: hypothetical protein ACRD2B_03785 [Terriglobia bacterium]